MTFFEVIDPQDLRIVAEAESLEAAEFAAMLLLNEYPAYFELVVYANRTWVSACKLDSEGYIILQTNDLARRYRKGQR